jgi:ppGpp synthetase/RelA/SpoT-type nucleotidyltranferase
MDIIDIFIKNYRRQFDFYQKVSQLCAQQCEAGLDSLGIKAIVTYRAKRPDKLEAKLRKKTEEGKIYKTEEDIYDDILDIAGTRIALYFPADQDEIGRFIESQFERIKPIKKFPGDTKSEKKVPKKRFSGYSATHYIVNLRKSTLSASQQRYSNTPTEIQIASVLMHAWAEVEHDLIYKPAHGTLSDDEYAILDELNGLVMSGEIALERLQKALETRVTAKSRLFNNHYELASYLLEAAKPIAGEYNSEPRMGRVDLLFQLLVKAEMNKPDKIAPLIKDLKKISEQRPLAEQIVDVILASKPYLYKQYELIRNEQPYNLIKGKIVTSKKEQAIGFFMNQWIEFESLMLNLAKQKRPNEYVVSRRMMLPPNLEKLGLVDNKMQTDIEQLRRVRNSLVHGIDMPSSETLIQDGRSLEELIKKIKNLGSRESQV